MLQLTIFNIQLLVFTTLSQLNQVHENHIKYIKIRITQVKSKSFQIVQTISCPHCRLPFPYWNYYSSHPYDLHTQLYMSNHFFDMNINLFHRCFGKLFYNYNKRNSIIPLVQALGRLLLVQRSFGVLFIPILMDLHRWPSTFSTVLLADEHEKNDNKQLFQLEGGSEVW